MSHTITHIPMHDPRTHTVTFDMVENLYEGKGNCCRCGCGGEYFKPAEHQSKVESVLKKMASGKYHVESIDDYILEIVIKKWETKTSEQTKVQTIYLKRQKNS